MDQLAAIANGFTEFRAAHEVSAGLFSSIHRPLRFQCQ